MKDNYKTDVIFRKENEGSILAVFPYEIANVWGNVTCYAHIGQHSGACWDYFLFNTIPANESEYAGLKSELESIGYNLKIVKRRNYKRFLTELNKTRQ